MSRSNAKTCSAMSRDRRSRPASFFALAVLAYATACSDGVGTAVRLAVEYEPAWVLTSLAITVRDWNDTVEPEHEFMFLLPDAWADGSVAFEVAGFRGDVRAAFGKAAVAIERGTVVRATVSLSLLECLGDACVQTCDEGYESFETSCCAWASSATRLTAGTAHTCALTDGRDLWCWGNGASGQLGNDGMADAPLPVRVAPVGVVVVEISAGAQFTCALTGEGAAWCWGKNDAGQLGNPSIPIGNAASTLIPVAVDDEEIGSIAAISAGSKHVCALSTSRAAWCWGNNNAGQLGNPAISITDTSTDTASTAIPVAVVGLPDMGGIRGIAAGGNHTCAFDTVGSLWCWGSNLFGQLGDGGTAKHSVPVAVRGLAPVVNVAPGGNFTCALTTRDQVYCWGRNNYGQLGLGTTSSTGTDVLEPREVVGLAGVQVDALSAGNRHVCAIDRGGTAWCWGDNAKGQLGDRTTEEFSAVPVAIGLESEHVATIAPGDSHTCAATRSGRVWCWGGNGQGRLGRGFTSWAAHARPLPVGCGE